MEPSIIFLYSKKEMCREIDMSSKLGPRPKWPSEELYEFSESCLKPKGYCHMSLSLFFWLEKLESVEVCSVLLLVGISTWNGEKAYAHVIYEPLVFSISIYTFLHSHFIHEIFMS